LLLYRNVTAPKWTDSGMVELMRSRMEKRGPHPLAQMCEIRTAMGGQFSYSRIRCRDINKHDRSPPPAEIV
jgi:hypothetical protein